MPIPSLKSLLTAGGNVQQSLVRDTFSALAGLGGKGSGRAAAWQLNRARQGLLASRNPLERMATRQFGVGAGLAVKHSSRLLNLTGRVGFVGAAAALGVGATAAVGTAGLAYGASRALGHYFGAPSATEDTGMLKWSKHDIPFTNKTFPIPELTSRVGNLIGTGALYAGIGQGVRNDYDKRNWSVTEAMHSGALEVEKDNFMGATGSLTLAMYKQRYGRPARQEIQQSRWGYEQMWNTARNVQPRGAVHGFHVLQNMFGRG